MKPGTPKTEVPPSTQLRKAVVGDSPMKRIVRKLAWVLAKDFMQRRKDKAIPFWFPEYFEKTKSIFVHVPKTGGVSIAMALYERQLLHTTWRAWVALSPRRCRDYYSFAVVRDPIDRFLSAYYFLKQGGIGEGDKRFAEEALADFKVVEELIVSLTDMEVRKKIFSYWHFRPQSDFVDAGPGEPCIKHLIPFEHLTDGFRMVAKALGREVTLPHLNVSVRNANHNLSKESVAILNDLYQRDGELYSMARELRKS